MSACTKLYRCFFVFAPYVGLRINDCCTITNTPPPSLSTVTSNLHFSKFNFNERSSTTCLRRPSFTLQSPLQHRPIVENIISDSNTYRLPDQVNNTSNHRRSFALKRSDSYSPGRRRFIYKLRPFSGFTLY